MSRKPIIYSLTTMHESGMGRLREAGEVRMSSSFEPSVLNAEIADADALVIRTAGDINAALMDRAPSSASSAVTGSATTRWTSRGDQRGIQVVYTPGANTESVAEHVFAMMIGLSKHFPGWSRPWSRGGYNDRTKLVGRDIAGKTLGIVGFGRIGRRVGRSRVRGSA